MANVLDYLRWRGDLLLRNDCFDEVDAMILARLSYLPFDGIVPSDFHKGISLQQAAGLFLIQDGCEEKVLCCEDLEFLAVLRESARFCGMELSGYVNQVDAKLQKQFCAVTIKIEEQTYFISYRGTDNTLVGWKEDFNMAFMTPIPSQQSAGEYFMAAADCLSGRFLLGGHSKGGNLAVYAAAVCGSGYADRILKIYNFDGPGFEHDFRSKDGYASVSGKICTYIPQSSVVGMLLDHEEEYEIVESSRVGVTQHDLYSWDILGKSFVRQDELTKESQVLNLSLKEWISGMDYEQRQQFVDTVCRVFENLQDKTVEELTAQWYRSLGNIMASLKNMDTKDKKNIVHTMRSLLKILTKNMR